MHFGAPPSLMEVEEPCLEGREEGLCRKMRRWLSVARAIAREGDFRRKSSMGMVEGGVHVVRCG